MKHDRGAAILQRYRRLAVIAAIALFVAISIPAARGDSTPPPQSQSTKTPGTVTAFVGVHVVPMNRQGVLKNRTVIVRGDRVAKIGRTGGVEVPEGAVVIDAGGKYLMPGLADMHVHVWCEGDLLLYVANGVTTVRNMSGAQLHLDWKKRLAAGDLLGPTLHTTGPIIREADDPEHARTLVIEHKEAGYDFVKVYSGLTRAAYNAIMATAAEHEIRVVGHVPYAVSVEYALDAGQYSIEHLDGYGLALEKEPPYDGANYYVRELYGWENGALDRIPALAKKTHESDAWICPTLGVNDARLAPLEVKLRALKRPEIRYVFPDQLRDWKRQEGHAEGYRSWRASDVNRDRMTKAAWDAGGHVLLGTDTANPFLIPGFSIHGELGHLVEAGLTPYEALRTGTRNAAEFLGRPGEFGAVAEGLRADLILLEANPLEDVRHVASRVGVMVRGRWYAEAELQRRLEDLAASYAEESQSVGPAADK